jgi:LysM repeat protein
MQKDLKIGFGVGTLIVAALGLWLATRPNLSTNSRITELQTADDENNPHSQTPKPSNTAELKKPVSREYQEASNITEKKLDNTITTEEPSRLLQQAGAIQDKSAKTEQPAIIHTIKKGETLSVISKQYYGTENEWRKIFDANRNRIIDANKLRPGTRIIIPK